VRRKKRVVFAIQLSHQKQQPFPAPPPNPKENNTPMTPPPSHNHRNMVIHKLIDIPQKARRHHADGPKRNARQIHPLVALRKRRLARRHHHPIRRLIALDPGNELELVEQGGAGEGDGFADEGGVFDAQVQGHGAADVVFGVGDEFVDEDVVVGCVANGAADDADGEGEGGDGGDEVLWGGLVKGDFGGGFVAWGNLRLGR